MNGLHFPRMHKNTRHREVFSSRNWSQQCPTKESLTKSALRTLQNYWNKFYWMFQWWRFWYPLQEKRQTLISICKEKKINCCYYCKSLLLCQLLDLQRANAFSLDALDTVIHYGDIRLYFTFQKRKMKKKSFMFSKAKFHETILPRNKRFYCWIIATVWWVQFQVNTRQKSY